MEFDIIFWLVGSTYESGDLFSAGTFGATEGLSACSWALKASKEFQKVNYSGMIAGLIDLN